MAEKRGPLTIARSLDGGARYEETGSGGSILCSSPGDAINVLRAIKAAGHAAVLSGDGCRIYLDL